MNRSKVIYKVSIISIIINSCLTLLKLFSGIIGNSKAMISDAIHSLSDVFTTLIVLISAKIASKESDQNHPYGHERIECVFSSLLALILCLTGLFIGYKGIKSCLNINHQSIAIPSFLALFAAILSIITKELMYRYTIYYAKKINSTSLSADAHHHRSDALSSVGSLIGIIFSKFGLPIMDSVASIIICIFIVKAAIRIFVNSMNQMIDCSADLSTVEDIKNTILNVDGVIKIDLFKTRLFAAMIYVDVEIAVDKHLSLIAAHNIAENVHNSLEKKYSNIKHCMVHVNPYIE